MGVIVMDLDDADRVACLDVIPREMVTDESEADVDIDTDPETAPADD
jgi:hypothetical protein